jgi:hypothetical protein
MPFMILCTTPKKYIAYNLNDENYENLISDEILFAMFSGFRMMGKMLSSCFDLLAKRIII